LQCYTTREIETAVGMPEASVREVCARIGKCQIPRIPGLFRRIADAVGMPRDTVHSVLLKIGKCQISTIPGQCYTEREIAERGQGITTNWQMPNRCHTRPFLRKPAKLANAKFAGYPARLQRIGKCQIVAIPGLFSENLPPDSSGRAEVWAKIGKCQIPPIPGLFADYNHWPRGQLLYFSPSTDQASARAGGWEPLATWLVVPFFAVHRAGVGPGRQIATITHVGSCCISRRPPGDRASGRGAGGW